MDRKIRSKAGQAIDALRKIIAEPMFGQIKAIRGLDRFLLWGTERSESPAAESRQLQPINYWRSACIWVVRPRWDGI
jgi:hypothetical protein